MDNGGNAGGLICERIPGIFGRAVGKGWGGPVISFACKIGRT